MNLITSGFSGDYFEQSGSPGAYEDPGYLPYPCILEFSQQLVFKLSVRKDFLFEFLLPVRRKI